MSVINQVLNQLEERGAPIAPEQTLVRAVPQGKRSLALPLIAVGLALAGGFAAWQWIQMRKPVPSTSKRPVPSSVEGPKAQSVAAFPSPAPVAQPAAELSVAAPVPASAVVAPVVDSTTSIAAASEPPPEEVPPPASRLSFELASVPLPSTLREPNSMPARKEPPAPVAKPHVAVPPTARVPAAVAPMKQVSPEQRADAEYRQAVAAMQQGHVADAVAGYREVLRLNPAHDEARQALVALLLENKQGAEAERVLQERLSAKPGHTGFAMLLARLQVEHGALDQALTTLEKSLTYADAQADYQAFFAALLQRRNRHKEAITHYQIVLQLAPDNGVWLMGYGISLQSVQRTDDARNAFRRALESRTLSTELQAFVRQKLREL